ncbi:hypothetical protein ACFOUV_14700 [Oceanobacillus longus]|uniref:Phage abortive infection protein n=1 Tax=Oceanobacillus longus TaxID=930120 RepID=A0ABV8H1H3_9BACI
MPKSKLFSMYLFILCVFAATIIISIIVHPIETLADLVNFGVTTMSLVISFIAFIIAMKTYISIDSVNRVTQMTGNVLENENYTTSIPALLREYTMSDLEDVGEAIFLDLEKRFSKKSKTAIEFANNLQHFIDLIIVFPALFNSDEVRKKYIARMDKLFILIERRRDTLLAISTGNLTLFDETVKLIKSVIKYQKLISSNDFDISSSLLEVRGTMLKNAVTQTVYYNYLGLYYNKKAMQLLRKKLEMENKDLLEIESLKQLKDRLHKLSSDDFELISIYLKQSLRYFRDASECCKEDIMWEGFIKYNEARTLYFSTLLFAEEYHVDWDEVMNEAINARKKMNLLIRDILPREGNTYLQRYFIYQEFLVCLVKINIQIAEQKDITDSRNSVRYFTPNYDGLLEDKYMNASYGRFFSSINRYHGGIKGELEKERI